MADSKLVTYENYTTHCDSRNGKKIQKIFVHHMAGIMTVKQCGNVFKTREASAHYGIDATGAVGQYVQESKRAWSVASRYYDEMAISIELANSTTAPTWKVSQVAIEKCIDLIVDICKRNGIEKINYTGDLSGNLCMHCWVVSTACVPTYSEVLTRNGWRRIDEVEEGDEIVCADINGLNLFFDEIYDKVPVKMQDTYECRGLIATKDHRMVYRTQQGQDYRIDFYGNLLQKKDTNHIYVPLAGNFNGEGLPITDDLIRFIVATQADGHYMHEYRSNNDSYYGLEFHLKKERKIERIKGILDSLNLDYRENHKSDGSVSIRIYNSDGINVVNDICEKYLDGKKFSWELLNLSREQADVFLDEIMLWDGCIAGQKYSSKEKQNLDVVNAIAALNNRGSKVVGSDVIFKNVPYLQLTEDAKRKTSDKHREVTCVSVRSGMFLVRQNGKTFVIGNCPGPYLKTQFTRIANSVNEKLKGKTVTYGKMIKYTANRVVNVYADHSISSRKVGKLKKGSIYTATKWYRDDWCYVPYVKGWVPIKGSKGTYLEKAKVMYTIVNPSGVNVYADHTTKSKCLGNVKRGSTLTATQWYGAWAYMPSVKGWVAVSCLHQGDRANALLFECAEIAKVLKKYNFRYSTSNLKYTLAAAVKSDHRIDCAHYVSFAMQALNILPSGKYIWLNKHINGNGASYIKKSNLVTITYPNKLPSKCNLKPGDICGWGYTVNGVEGQHTMVFAGKDAKGNYLWYTGGTSDVNNESYGPKQKPTYMKRNLNVLIRLK